MADRLDDNGEYAAREICNVCRKREESALPRYKIYRRAQTQKLNTILLLLIDGWRKQRRAVEVILQGEGFTCVAEGDIPELQLPEKAKSHTLVLTDSAAMAKAFCREGFVCVGCAGEYAGANEHYFEGAGLVLEGAEAVNISYMEEYLCHMLGQAVQVAETSRLILKEISAEEIDGLCAISRQCDSRFLLDPENEDFFTREGLQAYIRQIYRLCGYGLWSVLLKGEGRREPILIGCCGLSDVPCAAETGKTSRVELQYMLGEKYRRQGYGCEMCREALKLAAERAGCAAVWLRVHPDNLPSLKLAERLGFQRSQEEEGGNRMTFYKIL